MHPFVCKLGLGQESSTKQEGDKGVEFMEESGHGCKLDEEGWGF